MSRLAGRWGLLAWLTAVWVGLWGSISVANVLGGLVVAVAVLLAVPTAHAPSRGVVRPLAVVRFAGFFLVDLVRASVQVVVLVVRPRRQLRQAVVAVEVAGATDQLLTLLANTISLTPGTLTLEADRESRTLYVHVLQLGPERDAVERVRRSLLHAQRLAVEAFGSPQARAAVTLLPGGRP